MRETIMPVNKESYQLLKKELEEEQVTLVAVSKTKPVEDILDLYNLGHRDFGENYVQEMVTKTAQLPKDIRWHYIGHLQTNKVKLIAPFVQLIHGVDSLKLLEEINKQGERSGRVLDCLLQVHIAMEETKFGLDEGELDLLIKQFENLKMANVRICGLMGMASFTDDMNKVRQEFQNLKRIFDRLKTNDSRLTTLSMGMSNDYKIAIEEGSNMLRIGSLIFGERAKAD
ncbi:MAG TPA: YggS family pyridoxal phosphate-dependent enzyme [Chitinophagaceae bacterium]|nr:YggS family pyridoxal phosphate-dependent enzyme [Chitinophagaceae bacterium]